MQSYYPRKKSERHIQHPADSAEVWSPGGGIQDRVSSRQFRWSDRQLLPGAWKRAVGIERNTWWLLTMPTAHRVTGHDSLTWTHTVTTSRTAASMLFILTCTYIRALVSQVFTNCTEVFLGDNFWKCTNHNYSPLLFFSPQVYWFSESLCMCIRVKHKSPPHQSLDHQCYQNTKTKMLVGNVITDTGIPKAFYTKLVYKLWKSHRL